MDTHFTFCLHAAFCSGFSCETHRIIFYLPGSDKRPFNLRCQSRNYRVENRGFRILFSVGTKENMPKTEGYLHISVNSLHSDNLITWWALAKTRKHIWYSVPDVFDSTISFSLILRQSVALWDIRVSFSSAFIPLLFLICLQFYCYANVTLKFSQAQSTAHETCNNTMAL